MSSLVPVERGFNRSIKDCIYGNENEGWRPIRELVGQFNQYPGLLDIVLEIEGLICRRGTHASGVILYNESPFNTGAVMRSSDGALTTQFDLGDAEACGDVKFDFLLTKQVEKLSVAIDLLQKDGCVENNLSKREIYNKYFHPEVIDIKDERIWDFLNNENITDLFQLTYN